MVLVQRIQDSPLESELRANGLRINADVLQRHCPSLQANFYPDGQAKQIWNSETLTDMYLEPGRYRAKVLWPHCQQTFAQGQAEDFSSWDDWSQPWSVSFATWVAAWLDNMERGGGHIRPGKR